MVRLVHITVPHNRAAAVLDMLGTQEHAHGVGTFDGPDDSLIMFRVVEKHLSNILTVLSDAGIGVDIGRVDILALQSTKPSIASLRGAGAKKRKYNITDRMTVEEIYDTVDSQAHLTFDYLANTVVAGAIAAVGLISDSSVSVVASMLVSPLMGPILGISFGAVIKNQEMAFRSLRNEAWGLILCILVGFVFGFCVAPFYGPCGVKSDWAMTQLRSVQIESRGTSWSLISGLAIAMPSGIGVALAITGGGINALVGVAIAAALLPPVVNFGVCMALSSWYRICKAAGSDDSSHPAWSGGSVGTESHHFLHVGFFSFALFAINFAVIFLFAALTFKLKRVTQLTSRSAYWKAQMTKSPLLLAVGAADPLASQPTTLFDSGACAPTVRDGRRPSSTRAAPSADAKGGPRRLNAREVSRSVGRLDIEPAPRSGPKS